MPGKQDIPPDKRWLESGRQGMPLGGSGGPIWWEEAERFYNGNVLVHWSSAARPKVCSIYSRRL